MEVSLNLFNKELCISKYKCKKIDIIIPVDFLENFPGHSGVF